MSVRSISHLACVATLLGFLIQSSFAFSQDSKMSVANESILLKPWVGPYGGVPPFRMIDPAEFLPAFDVAIEMAQQVSRIWPPVRWTSCCDRRGPRFKFAALAPLNSITNDCARRFAIRFRRENCATMATG